MSADIPVARLEFFRKEIGLDESKLAAIRPFADKLAARARKAGAYIDALVRKTAPRVRLEMTLEFFDGALKDFWADWYARLWTRAWDADFLRELWLQGANAARLGIDLQYVMLGEVKCRQIFIRAVREDVPPDHRGRVASAVNDLLDLCLMVRAKGHVSYHSEVAEPLLQGLFHQTRNPLTVIGGTATRLMRSDAPGVPDMARVILDEALRLERMTRDISTCNSIELAEPTFEAVAVEPLVRRTLEGLRSWPGWPQGLEPALSFDPAHPEVDADPNLLREIFKEVLVNALEAMPADSRALTVASSVDPATPSHLSVVVRGSGELPKGQDVSRLYLPFHSTKPQGTGFGLPIARAAAHKCFGKVSLAQDGDTVACTVKLPLKGRIDELGFLAWKDF
jgi:signal transduction histidine kinase